MAVHDFFEKENFVHVQTPILTSSDCEGAGDLFEVKVCRMELASVPGHTQLFVSFYIKQQKAGYGLTVFYQLGYHPSSGPQ